jgi:hypothetical protein
METAAAIRASAVVIPTTPNIAINLDATMIPSTPPVEPQLALRAKSKQRPSQQGEKSKRAQMIVAMTVRAYAQNLPVFRKFC